VMCSLATFSVDTGMMEQNIMAPFFKRWTETWTQESS